MKQTVLDRPKDAKYEDEMVRKWYPLVYKIAGAYNKYGEFDDRLQDGLLGLLYAIRWYDPDKNVPFAKTAALCIKTRIIETYFKHKSKEYLLVDDLAAGGELEEDVADDDETYKGEFDDILTDDELDALVLNSKEYGEGYRSMRNRVKEKIKNYILINNDNDDLYKG